MNRIVSASGQLVAADIVFFDIDMNKHDILEISEQFLGEMPGKNNLYSSITRCFLRQNLVLCFDWTAIVIKTFFRDKGLVGFLTNPVQLQPLKQILIQRGLIEAQNAD